MSGVRVYLAGRFSRRDELNRYAARLREWGFTVDARWLTEEHEWFGHSGEDELRAAQGFAADDIADIAKADLVLVFTEHVKPGGRNRGGRHVEYGLALGLSKDVAVVGPLENVFHTINGPVFIQTDEMHRVPARVWHLQFWEDVPYHLAALGYSMPPQFTLVEGGSR